ncbi:dihydrolipoamide acetyltransferase family protein [Thiolapillus brandeum]|uniref:Dihydrolipoamide acetyltransferase component of pyruvate dehydrogenase complex n=1 Tax=Thiolapillus brandeum TaxID=1076588 RepID=A0A7U6GJC3_9GAMM|nr:dihydrolipoamide acetyltransferase family protein [Thiolapillus brandeum]BAO44687.1 pyruvate dehydrogenase E2 component [Thiolapillus brandeum]
MKKQPVTMPVLSDTMESGHLLKWLKQPGDKVKKGDILAEVESDKAIMDVEAFSDGYVAGPLATPGSDIPTGTVIGYISDSAENVGDDAALESPSPASGTGTASLPEQSPHNPETPPTQVSEAPAPLATHPINHDSRDIKASPYARGLARELGIDLATVPPGPQGIVQAPQVLAAAMQGPQPKLDAGPEWRFKMLSSMRRAIADNMSATVRTPTFRVSSDLRMDLLHQAAKDRKYSLTLLLARALALTVTEHPLFNAVYTPAALALRQQVNVGIAADVPGGLLTPVLQNAAERPLSELAEDWRILKNKLRQQRLVPGDYEGATIYLSNLGMFKTVSSFEAIVPLGAAAILSVAAERNSLASFTLSCDHRVVYGADAARFLGTFGAMLENPGDWS